LLGLDGYSGSIEDGKRADLVALDAEKRIVLAMVNGTVLKSSV
jgi:N-acetylglucosamine-6-phosphate deacetylase